MTNSLELSGGIKNQILLRNSKELMGKAFKMALLLKKLLEA